MNDAHQFPPERTVDFSRLNDAERHVLKLLAQGHTAKSIANLTGSTPTAVNERLREARRKTGMGSSRELARLLCSQENRDEEMGVVSARSSITSHSPVRIDPWRRSKGVFAMIALLITAAATGALLLHQSAASNVVDPIVGRVPTSENSPERLYARVRSEKRDLGWAPKAEQILRARYLKIESVTGPNGSVRVICGSSLCEVAGIIDAPDRPDHRWDPNDPLNKAMDEIQTKTLHDLLSAGLIGEGGMFGGSSPLKPDRTTFVQYYRRKVAP